MIKGRILVAGGAGFIGSHVNKMLNQAGYSTIVLDNLSSGALKSVVCGEFIRGDIGDSGLLARIFSAHPIQAVMHFAAFINVGESVQTPLEYYQNNVCRTLTLLKAMHTFGIKIFIFSSSAAIFGLPQSQTINESHPMHPINPYGSSKLMVERILENCDSAYGIKFSCLRYFNAAGGDPEGEVKNYKKRENNLIPIVLKALMDNDSITINGSDYPTPDGTCVRDFIHVYDLGKAHIAAMEQLMNGGPSSFYNLGNGRGFTVQEIIETASAVTGIAPKLVYGPRRPGDPPCLLADSQKAIRELHWIPQYPKIETMIKHAWQAIAG